MAMLTLGEAARLCRVPKSTISRAIKSGRLSAGRSDDGSYAIDPAELHRVYPLNVTDQDGTAATDSATGGVARDATAPAVSNNPSPATGYDQNLAIRLASAEAELRGLREMVEELRRSREKWEAQAERLTLALPAPAAAPPPPCCSGRYVSAVSASTHRVDATRCTGPASRCAVQMC